MKDGLVGRRGWLQNVSGTAGCGEMEDQRFTKIYFAEKITSFYLHHYLLIKKKKKQKWERTRKEEGACKNDGEKRRGRTVTGMHTIEG